MLSDIKKFHELGFAVHLLKPKSKRPIDLKWTTGPRKSLDELKKQYRPGMNIGVRLGAPSKIGKYYLTVIDCDVKSSQEKHLREMSQKIRDLFPGIEKAAIVASGRSNGSRHYYIVTREPTKTRRLAQSPVKVEVKMPSVEPTSYEKEHLHETKLLRGFRLRPAWEISIMGDGSQVVLPPSLHPDTGMPYKWTREWQKPYLLNVVTEKPQEASSTSSGEISVATGTIDLAARGVPLNTIAAIEEGEGVEDRSGALFKVAMTLLKAGLAEAEVLNVLTDKSTYLGKAAYDHAKTTNRERAAKWILKYTMPRARTEVDPGKGFDEPPPKKLTKKEAKKQSIEIDEDFASGWEERIARGPINQGAKVKTTLANLVLILDNVVGEKLFLHNEFSGLDIYGMDAPWGGEKADEIKDVDLLNMKMWFAHKWGIEPNINLVNEALNFIAKRNIFHPVKDYLNKLEWDGVERIDTWLKDYMEGDAPEPYLSAVSRKMLVAMVARIYEPGRKFDQVVILQGLQGKGKSTALRKLVGDEWFSDATLNVNDKDSILAMRNIWLRELGELSGMRKADVEQLKEFISRTTDRIRVPFGKRTEAFPRHCIFVGTTNKDEFLKDDTGNRRYWPLNVGKCDFEGIETDRDQLFAEARIAWEFGEVLYLEDAQAEAIAASEQSKRMESDTLVDNLETFFEENAKKPKEERFNSNKFTLADLFKNVTHVTLKEDRSGQLRLASALRSAGYEKKISRDKGGRFHKYWVSKGNKG